MSDGLETVGSLVAEARSRFLAAHLADAALDARILVGGLLGLSTTELVLRGGDTVSNADGERIRAAIQRRLGHEPVYRILGQRAFYGLELKLSTDTLEPRQDTEMLVDRMLPYVQRVVAAKGRAHLLDVGTGTGAIALALLQECPQATGIGCDISADAVATAAQNAVANGLAERFTAVTSNWLDAISDCFDIIVSNPPYIVSSVVVSLQPEVRGFDPLIALDGGEDGMDGYRALAADAKRCLQPDGIVGVEIGYDQKQSVIAMFLANDFHLLETAQDYGGRDRVLIFGNGARD